jgi:hypothetical protein
MKDASLTAPTARRWALSREYNVLALIKGDEKYVYIYDDDSRESLIETFHQHAADPELALNWFDAIVLTQKAEEQGETAPASLAPVSHEPRPRI